MAKAVASITPKDIAEELGLTPLQVRIYLRSEDQGVGRGKRYKFTEAQAKKIKNALAKEYDLNDEE